MQLLWLSEALQVATACLAYVSALLQMHHEVSESWLSAGRGASSGVGFAIPVDQVTGLVQQALTYGKVGSSLALCCLCSLGAAAACSTKAYRCHRAAELCSWTNTPPSSEAASGQQHSCGLAAGSNLRLRLP